MCCNTDWADEGNTSAFAERSDADRRHGYLSIPAVTACNQRTCRTVSNHLPPTQQCSFSFILTATSTIALTPLRVLSGYLIKFPPLPLVLSIPPYPFRGQEDCFADIYSVHDSNCSGTR